MDQFSGARSESLLTEAGIKFMSKGEQIQGMFGGGQFGGTNLIVPLEIFVLPSDAEAALAILEGGPGPVGSGARPDEETGV